MLLACLLLLAAPVQQERIAVLEFEVSKGTSVDRIFFSDRVRGEIRRAAPGLFVMTRESLEELLKASGKSLEECAGKCEVETGRLLQADYVVSGRIAKVGKRLFLSMRLHATRNGSLLGSEEAVGAGEDELVDATPAAVKALLAQIPRQEAAPESAPAADEAAAAVSALEARLEQLFDSSNRASWKSQTDVTAANDQAATQAGDALRAAQGEAARQAAALAGKSKDPAVARKLSLLRLADVLPKDPAHQKELLALQAEVEGLFGNAKACRTPSDCRNLSQLSAVLASSRKPPELLEAWQGWHDAVRPMRAKFLRLIALQNEAARDNGFRDMADYWQSGYDLPAAQFAQEKSRLWQQLRPLYEELHCAVRAGLQKAYGAEAVPDGAPIPAHLLGNMWGQDWSNLAPLVGPVPATDSVTPALRAQQWTPRRIVSTAEKLWTSMGFEAMPPTFWDRSLFEKPSGREVICHASAWDLGGDDLRLKACVAPARADLQTVHHELGHIVYFHAYRDQPYLFRSGANDAFHEAVANLGTLSMTPGYLRGLGLPSTDDVIQAQLATALETLPLLAFAGAMDEWRFAAYAGEVPEARLNGAWWDLRRRFQGIAPPSARTEKEFDPGAKYHIAASIPYTRYFLAQVLAFQLHRALCGKGTAAHACSLAGKADVAAKLGPALALGQSRPWQEALFKATGERKLDAGALVEYFAPLLTWLHKQNEGRRCGW